MTWTNTSAKATTAKTQVVVTTQVRPPPAPTETNPPTEAWPGQRHHCPSRPRSRRPSPRSCGDRRH